MKCTRCQQEESMTSGVLAFTKPESTLTGKIPEDVSGEYCNQCCADLFEMYVISYRPDKCSRDEARKI